MTKVFDAIIIGGGASGLVLCERLNKAGLFAIVLEAGERVGKKLLAAGNGKCNLTNLDMVGKYYNSSFTESIINRYDTQTVIKYFEDLGLKTRETEGRIYPYSESAGDVLNVLRSHTEAFCRCGEKVETIKKIGDTFEVNGLNGKAVIIATGSNATTGYSSYHLAEKFSHTAIAPLPSLVGLNSTDDAIKGLSGIRVKAKLSLYHGTQKVKEETGELLFKDNGISGIVTFNLSSEIARSKGNGYSVEVDFIPEFSPEEIEKAGAAAFLRRPIFNAVKKQAASGKASVSAAAKSFRIIIDGLGDIKNAQVVSGGLNNNEFNPNTLESKLVKNLYAVGEALDVDGVCGGYNLHWAFSSALACSEAIINKFR